MAPATSSCPDASLSITLPTEETDAPADCHWKEGADLVKRNKQAFAILPADQSKRAADDKATVQSRAQGLSREPAFIAAIVLTAFILLGGFIVTKLSHTRLPHRRPRNCVPADGQPNDLAIQSSEPGTTSPLTRPFPQSKEHASTSSPFSLPTSPSSSFRTSISASQGSPAVQPESCYAGRPLPQIILSRPYETFPEIEALAEEALGEFADRAVAKALEERAQTMIAMFPQPEPRVRSAAYQPTTAFHDSWPRLTEDSEASDHSTEDSAPVNLFSSGSSSSSLTSASTTRSDSGELDLDDDTELYGRESEAEVVFEVKRGQAQSLELAKGRLMSWPALPSQSSSKDIFSGRESEGDPRPEEQNVARSWHRRRTLSRASSIAPIPTLIITEPSTLSLVTVTSSTSNLSMDLTQFPVPPLDLEPAAFWQRLNDEVDSSLALKQRRSMPVIVAANNKPKSQDAARLVQTSFFPQNLMHVLLSTGLVALTGALTYAAYLVLIHPRFNPLSRLAGPALKPGFWSTNLAEILSATISAEVHEIWKGVYGRSFRIRGAGPWDDRLLTLDPVSVAYIMKNSTIYEKPWQSRKLISSLIGCGMLAAEGQMHKRQRRVATPAFSIQNLRALVPLVFRKGDELKNKWLELAEKQASQCKEPLRLDVCHWVSRATFDVIGVAGFDYNFNAIQNETNELFNAYKDMFEIAISQGNGLTTAILIYAPWWYKLFPTRISETVDRCQKVIKRIAGNLIQEKKQKIQEGQRSGIPYAGKDLLSLLLKSNVAVDLPPDQRISDEDILNNVNTFMFAGSDTSSLAVTWTLHLLANHPQIQTKLRDEMISALPGLSSRDISQFTEDEIHTVYSTIASLPLLDNVVKESIRLIPPVHSTIRVATKDDEIPTSFPVVLRDGRVDTKRSVSISKGSFVHIAVEGFNKDKEFWGPDAWEFNPDRWDNLPEAAKQLPGLYSNTLTFSGGPRSCIGQRFSLIEIKSFIYTLITNFVFKPTETKVVPSNVYVYLSLLAAADSAQIVFLLGRISPRGTPKEVNALCL
ncbi:hypothetical protein NMY22_g14142 [Coprinellus aureogranulatus]|nr:hypothetical protein NMY22_g14142 [Coprinellus aureogranulatus]